MSRPRIFFDQEVKKKVNTSLVNYLMYAYHPISAFNDFEPECELITLKELEDKYVKFTESANKLQFDFKDFENTILGTSDVSDLLPKKKYSVKKFKINHPPEYVKYYIPQICGISFYSVINFPEIKHKDKYPAVYLGSRLENLTNCQKEMSLLTHKFNYYETRNIIKTKEAEKDKNITDSRNLGNQNSLKRKQQLFCFLPNDNKVISQKNPNQKIAEKVQRKKK